MVEVAAGEVELLVEEVLCYEAMRYRTEHICFVECTPFSAVSAIF